MIEIRKSSDRGMGDHGWLKSQHSFSFADYYDERFTHFHSLRVINEDRVQGGAGFPSHSHRDMEIISYVLTGKLEHKDSMGNHSVIKPGEVQRMSAGSGVTHSEYNLLGDQEAHFLQIWILPKYRGASPSYAQKSFEKELERKNLVLVASEVGRDESLVIQQDVDMYVSRMKQRDEIHFTIRSGREIWIQLLYGKMNINGKELEAGDGLFTRREELLKIQSHEDCEFLLFDLAPL